jgi:hypothetical protein
VRFAPVAVGDEAVSRTGAAATVDAVTCRRVHLAGLGWLHRTESGAELRGKLDRRLTVTFGAQSSGA